MAQDSTQPDIPRHGDPAILARLFGWCTLTILAAFLINNVLVVGFGYSGTNAFLDGTAPSGWVHLALYAVAIAVAAAVVLRGRTTSLRWDAHRIHKFNVYLIRALFWAVFLIGITDATIAFMRAENLIEPFLGSTNARLFSRPSWVGSYVHIPLIVVAFGIATVTRTLGFFWLAFLIVIAELLIVISRFMFSYEQALMGDLVRYWYAALFLFSSAYTLFDEGHVRVDVLYAGFGRTTRGIVNGIGTILLGMSTAWVILAVGFGGKQSIINAPITSFEISQAGPFGLYTKYQMAAFIGLFAVTMLIQFVSYFFDAVADKRDEPGHREIAQSSAH
ncbi:Tripartite ATP-independent transporter, DctQ component [Aliiroseovarius sediminilitoris]|uniref:TRAP transporter small permease protein n=1 Tax=Aliiroseovarius sediminilitoris TaxID=1173584 RepID=A0A1I0MVW5_9RHOB|nr:TRAP transporter small permease subunit [Aliiroseovarius sediminilitoris]SEV92493.1 Tripartite ATP-independent transporter, DctQ component [Aliiroseovarius sediminilitoris]